MTYEERLADIIFRTVKLETKSNELHDKMDENMKQSAKVITALASDSGETLSIP